MSVRYTRRFKYRDKGPDVEGIGRALSRAGVYVPLAVFNAMPKRVRRTWGIGKQRALKKFKRRVHLKPDYQYGEKAHAKLSRFYDSRAKWLMLQYGKDERTKEQLAFARLLAAMKTLSDKTPGYSYGGGHGTDLDRVSPTQGLDCSSSTSKALHMAGLFPARFAWVSGDFARSYGKPGKGRFYTVYANDGHVWIRLHKSIWWRFDTSPHGDPRSPKSGPRLRFLPRPTYGFSARHWEGM